MGIKYLVLHTDLEATDGGKDQQEISDWIENDPRWLAYVEQVNLTPIPEDEDCEYCPTEEWLEAQEFVPDDLVSEACEALGWVSTPESLSLNMNFGHK